MSLKFNFKMLITGGLITGLTAIWHLLMIVGGPGWYAFAHAPEYIVESARQHTLIAPLMAVLIAGLMLTCTVYSLSGAGLIGRIPLLKTALVTIAIICLVRAVVVIPYLIHSKLDIWNMVASFGWFFVGICFLLGSIAQFIETSKSI